MLFTRCLLQDLQAVKNINLMSHLQINCTMRCLRKESCLPFLLKKKRFFYVFYRIYLSLIRSPFFSWDSIQKFHPLLCRFIPILLFIINIYFDNNDKSHCTWICLASLLAVALGLADLFPSPTFCISCCGSVLVVTLCCCEGPGHGASEGVRSYSLAVCAGSWSRERCRVNSCHPNHWQRLPAQGSV